MKLLQDWTNRVPLLILGSGASVSFNLPSMWSLGDYIKTSIHFTESQDQNQFEEFKVLFDRCGDLEKTLLEINLRQSVLKEVVLKTWELINKHDLEAYDSILADCNFPLSDLLRYLLSTSGRKVSIITTNYDRLAEYAASLAGAFICNGFSQNYIGAFSSSTNTISTGNFQGYSGQVNIWKVHGSLDWFKDKNDQEIQLPIRARIPVGYVPSIITPGLSKFNLTHSEPYRTIFAQADREIDSASSYLCIGYGFNDEHVQPKLITQIKRGKPIIVITKTLSSKCKELIIANKCNNYLLLEEDGHSNTKIYSSIYGELTIPDKSLWQLEQYLKIIL